MIKLVLALNVFGENLLKNANGEDATFEIITMLLGAFALGFLLRHLIGFRKKEYIIEQGDADISESTRAVGSDLSEQIERLKLEIDRLTNLKSSSGAFSLKGSEKMGLTSNMEEAVVTKKLLDSKTTEEVGIKSEIKNETAKDKSKSENNKPDDLKVIEGIGPALAKLLNENQIITYDHLANKTVTELEELLDKAGPRFRVHVPETWPEQASLLRDGKTDAFKALTERLKGGRRV